jgi:release factor glutamine methyltransferase
VQGRTVADLVHAAARRLAAAGIPDLEARLDAELLARHAFGRWDRSTYIVRAREPFPPEHVTAFDALVARRAAREPMAYIVGHAEFWGLEFEVTPAVLIPRPETELIVETVLGLPLVPPTTDAAKPAAESAVAGGVSARQAPLQIVDIGTGSGCLAVALACEFPSARLAATDTSAEAIEVARRNACRHGVDRRIAFLVTSFGGDASDCDLIVSNPPYVPELDRAALQPEVRDHEPASALFAGEDGLAVIRQLVESAWGDLGADRGWLVFEFGFGQADAVRALLETTPALEVAERGGGVGAFPVARVDLERDDIVIHRPWADVGIVNDLQGIPRVAVARKTALAPQAASRKQAGTMPP